MPRYFFHLEDGFLHPDEIGTDLPDLVAAKCAAVQLIAETLCNQPARFWQTESYKVTCADQDHLDLFTVQMVATLSPAVPTHPEAISQPPPSAPRAG